MERAAHKANSAPNPGKRPRLSHVWAREPGEHYVEPSWCSERLFAEEKFEGPIWDPSAGFGRIVIAAKKAGLNASGSDLVDRGWDSTLTPHDFLATELITAANIVCNPPFDLAPQFALHALKLARLKVAMIFPVARLNAAHWLRGTPLARIWLLTPRPPMPPGFVIARGEKPGGGRVDFCWLVFEQGHTGNPEVRWLHRDGGAP